MKWIDDYTWFNERSLSKEKKYLIYAYEDSKRKNAYVGLTKRLKDRHREHKFGRLIKGIRKYDCVHNFFCEVGEEMPEPIILRDSLTAEEAQKLEEYYKEQYEKQGWNTINIAKCGSLGAYSKWNNDNCKEEAKKYESRNKFRIGSPSAYHYALKNNLLDSYPWLKRKNKPNGYWDYKRCYEEAKKYEYIGDFQKYSASAFSSAFRNKWLKDYAWLKLKLNVKPNGYWSFGKCKECFRECNSMTEFRKKYPSALSASRKKGWINLFKCYG